MKQHHTIEIFSTGCPLCGHITNEVEIGKCKGSTATLQNPKYQSCIDACKNCLEACEVCLNQCCLGGNATKMTNCIKLCHDCADT